MDSAPAADTSAPTPPRRSGHVLYYDVLNVAACLAVLLLHFNGLSHAYSPTLDWLQAMLFECLFYWAVPIFFMLSGATLLGYRSRYDTKTFLVKRLSRTLVPFIAWSLIALVWKLWTGQAATLQTAPQPGMPPVALHLGPRTIVGLVLNTRIIDVYWFFIPLFALYLSMPLLSLVCDGTHDRTVWYAVAVGFVFNALLPCLLPAVGIAYNGALALPVVSGYVIYALLGYLLSRTELSQAQRLGIYALGAFGLLLRYVVTIVRSPAIGRVSELFWGYEYFPCLFLSVAVFVFARQVNWRRLFRSDRSVRVLARVASGSFGVYLMHMIFFWYALQATGLDGGRLLWRTVMPFVAYAVCLTITLLMKRVPCLRRIVP